MLGAVVVHVLICWSICLPAVLALQRSAGGGDDDDTALGTHLGPRSSRGTRSCSTPSKVAQVRLQ